MSITLRAPPSRSRPLDPQNVHLRSQQSKEQESIENCWHHRRRGRTGECGLMLSRPPYDWSLCPKLKSVSIRARVGGQARHCLSRKTYKRPMIEIVTALVVNGTLEDTSRKPFSTFPAYILYGRGYEVRWPHALVCSSRSAMRGSGGVRTHLDAYPSPFNDGRV